MMLAYESNSNFRFIDQTPNQRGNGCAHVALAGGCARTSRSRVG